MHEHDAQQVVGDAQLREEEIGTHCEYHHRNNHGRNQQRRDQALARQITVVQPDRSKRPQCGCNQGGKYSGEQAIFNGCQPDRIAKQLIKPPQAVVPHREIEVRLFVKSQRHDHQHRGDQKYQNGPTSQPQCPVAQALQVCGVGRKSHQPILTLPSTVIRS